MIITVLICTIPVLIVWTTKQDKVPENVRSVSLPKNNSKREIWWEEYYISKSQPKEEAPMVEEPKTYNIPQEDINALARTIWGEARGIPSKAEQAAVAWCVLNRVDAGYGNTVLEVVSAPGQFHGYSSSYPITDDLADLAKDVLTRWYREKDGEVDVGRTLPSDYYYFNGHGGHNWFRKELRSSTYWDWSLINPYE